MQASSNPATFRDAGAYRPHDLLRLRALPPAGNPPPWLAGAFAQAPFAVVRRTEAPPGFVAVGFRGRSRSDRHGAFVAIDAIESVHSPEAIAPGRVGPQREMLGAFAALRRIVELGGFDSLVWGPTGSVGFELATGQPTVKETSDLDLLVRTPYWLSRAQARLWRAQLESIEREIGLRIDAQLETPAGGVALIEWIEDKPRVMARSVSGPSLVADPWAPDALPREAAR